jgi:uncharacterized protein
VVSRKRRVRVVFDTNVLAGAFLSRNPDSPNLAAVNLWLVLRRIELVVSQEIVGEYLDVLHRLRVAERLVERLQQRISAGETVTRVNLGPRVVASRDPDDDDFLSTAKAGRADYLVTNDRDLLELAEAERKRLRFQIVTPQVLLAELGDR